MNEPKKSQILENLAMIESALDGLQGKDQAIIAGIAVDLAVLLLRKNMDYGSAFLKKPVLAPECNSGTAIRVRMSDKINRILNLLEYSEPVTQVEDETLDQSWLDLAGYCLIEVARKKIESRKNES